MTYVALMRDDNERLNKSQDSPVQKTGLRAFHDSVSKRLKGGA